MLREKNGEQQKERAGDLEPEGAAGPGEGIPHGAAEVAAALRDAADGPAQSLTLPGVARIWSRRRGRGLPGTAGRKDPPAEQARADAEGAAEGFRAHGASLPSSKAHSHYGNPFRFGFGNGTKVSGGRIAFLLARAIQHKVRERATGATGRGGPGRRVKDLKENLRKLVQQLGEAIHESVSESEQIAGVVQDIRRQGFDVLLMLEATIGLNEVAERNANETEAERQAGFTEQDVSFLRSLRIAIEGDEGGTDAPPDAGAGPAPEKPE